MAVKGRKYVCKRLDFDGWVFFCVCAIITRSCFGHCMFQRPRPRQHCSERIAPPKFVLYLGAGCLRTSPVSLCFSRWLLFGPRLGVGDQETHFVLYAEWRNFVSVDMTKVVERLFRVD